ncbi:hypothetical protein MMC10_010953 [Thelotrema lepadinum]|nr:hypothetical protein [Thelotrema lepadinum]
MDPITGIGFALGAGSFLFDVFDKAVQAYQLYSTAKSLANVSAHLVAKLLIEECRLIQWGDGIGIRSIAGKPTSSTRELDDRLTNNKVLYQTVLHALAGINETLTDIDSLTAKYGLHIFEEDIAEGAKSLKSEIVLPRRPGTIAAVSGHTESSAASKALKERAESLQASTSIRKKFKWAIKDRSGFEMLLERIRYYNDSLYCLLPRENVSTITRDVLANLIGSATTGTLAQYTVALKRSESALSAESSLSSQYATIASAAQVSLDIANGKTLPPDDLLVIEESIAYDGEDARLGILSRPGRSPARVLVEKLRWMPYASFSEDAFTRKATFERIAELAVLLKEPRHFGFATLPCLGVITSLVSENIDFVSETKLVYEIPDTVDPLEHPVSLHDVLTKEAFRRDEPPDIDLRFKLATSLAHSLHEMHCTGWLHRNISAKCIFFFKANSNVGLEGLDLGKPYITGFDAARAFTACGSIFTGRVELAIAANQHPGYVLLKYWSQQQAQRENTGDKLFYMPRHDYYSMGLVLLEIGMWRTLDSLVLRDLPLMGSDFELSDPDCPLEERLQALTGDVMFARQDMLDDIDPEDTQEIRKRENIWTAYKSKGATLAREEGLVDIVLDAKDVSDAPYKGSWPAWDVAYGQQVLREEAIRVCREKLGSRMGRRYREAVQRCLATDFGVDPKASKNIDWLRAFNWKVIQDLDKCCA